MGAFKVQGSRFKVGVGVIAAALVAACQAGPVGVSVKRPRPVAPAVTAIAPELPAGEGVHTPPAAAPRAVRALVDANGTGTLSGKVEFQLVADAYFSNSAANWRLLAQPAGRALLTLSTLEEALLGKNGQAVSGATAADGTFTIASQAPTDRAYVLNAVIAGNHRLSGLVLPGQSSVTVDEATTMVAETARWQMSDAPTADGRKSLADLDAPTLSALVANTRALLSPADFTASGAVPSLPALKAGNGLALRSQYLRTFGTRVLRVDGATSNPQVIAANALSDAWKSLLGYRPLAIAPMPTPGYTLLDGFDIAGDHQGHLFVAASGHIKLFCNVPRGPLWARTSSMSPGQFYTVAGDPAQAADFAALYAAPEAASVADPDAAPLLSTGFPTPSAHKLLVERVGATDASHLFFTSRAHHRVMLIPGADFTRFGRSFKAGRLYTVGGTGIWESWGAVVQADDPSTPDVNEEQRAYVLGDDGPAHQAPLVFPQGLDRDSRGNLYVSDSGYLGVPYFSADPQATRTEPYTNPAAAPGMTMHIYHNSLRMIRASDGKIFTLRLTRGGQPHAIAAQDVRVREEGGINHLYVTDTMAHQIFRVRLPDDLATLDAAIPASFEIEPVLGAYQKAGYVDTAAGGVYPDLTTIGRGLPREHVLLNSPLSVAFDHEGNLLASDYSRIHLIKQADLAGLGAGARVYPLAGAFDAGYLEGDSRFVTVRPRYMHMDAYRRTVFFPDATRNRLYMLHTARGAL